MNRVAGSDHDPALRPLMAAAHQGEFDQRLEALLAGVDRLVRDAIRRTLGPHFHVKAGSVRENIEDLRGEVMVLLVRKLREIRADASLDPIQNFSAYAAAVAAHACYAYLRRRYPEWTRLKNQVRYIVTHDPELALQRSEETDASRCVLTAWSCEGQTGNAETGTGIDAHALPLREAIKILLRSANGSMELNELVGVIAESRGIRGGLATPASIGDVESFRERVPCLRASGAPDDSWFLKQVWNEVRQLPLRQRLALLLNFRDDQGRGVLFLLPLTATASMRQIAEVLGMPAEELARMWNDLPIDDHQIAARLGISRQQVINLRKSARARLARRTDVHHVGR